MGKSVGAAIFPDGATVTSDRLRTDAKQQNYRIVSSANHEPLVIFIGLAGNSKKHTYIKNKNYFLQTTSLVRYAIYGARSNNEQGEVI